MSERPDGGAIAGLLTGALLGVTVAMLLAPGRSGPNPLLERGRAVLEAASGEPLSPSPGA